MLHSKKSLLALLLAMTLAMTTLTGCGDGEDFANSADAQKDATAADSKDSVVTLAQAADPVTLDPHRAGGDIGANITKNICENLAVYDANDQLIPELALSWEQTSENEWLYHLREGVSFSNGEPFNAEAVVYNLERANSKEYPRQAFEFRTYYDHCEVVNDYTLKVFTTMPDPLLPVHLGDIPMVEPKHSETVGEEGLSTEVIGTGSYTLEKWDRDQQIVLKANPNCWRGEPEVKKYVIKTIPESATRIAELLSGTVDIIYDVNFEDLPMLQGQKNVHIDHKLTKRVPYMAFNTCDWTPEPAILDLRVRQAMNYAVDNNAIIESLMGGFAYPLPTIYREDFPAHDPSIKGFEYNPQKAKELLKEAGYEDGFSIQCQVANGLLPKATEIAQAVASYLEEVGISMEVIPMELNTMRSVIINGQDQKKAASMFIWSWASKPEIVDSWLTGIVHSSGMSSYNAIDGYDELVDEIIATTDPAKKETLFVEFQNKLIDDPPYLYLFQQESIYGVGEKLDWSPSDHYMILGRELKLR